MNSIQNSITLIGNLGSDAKIFESKNGSKITRLSLATNEVYKNAKGEKVTNTHWHTCVAFGKLAEILGEYARKGQRMAVNGRLQYSQYKDKKGIDRTSAEVVIHDYIWAGKQQGQGAKNSQ